MAGVLGRPPFILGWDVAGTVDAVGFGVTRFQVGDRVYGMPWFPRQAAAYAEAVVAPSRHFALAPQKATAVEASGLPLAALTAWQALVDTAGLEAGDRVLIHAAAGGVGHLAVQIARARGAYVVATASAPKHALLRDLGADRVVDYRTTDVTDQVRDMDVVVDLVGGPGAAGFVACLRANGLLISVPSGVPDDLAAVARAAGVHATGLLVEPDHAALAAIAGLVDGGALRPVVAEVFPLEHAEAAHRLGEQGRTTGKLILKI